MHEATNRPVSPDKGTGYFPLPDVQYDVIKVIAEKSKALQAYDHYMRDATSNKDLMAVFEQIKADDRRHIEELKKFL